MAPGLLEEKPGQRSAGRAGVEGWRWWGCLLFRVLPGLRPKVRRRCLTVEKRGLWAALITAVQLCDALHSQDTISPPHSSAIF